MDYRFCSSAAIPAILTLCLVSACGADEKIRGTERALQLHQVGTGYRRAQRPAWALRSRGGREQVDIAQPQPDFHTDLPRLRQGGVGAEFWSVWVPVSTTDRGEA